MESIRLIIIYLKLIMLSFVLMNCTQEQVPEKLLDEQETKEEVLPNNEVDKSELFFDKQTSIWTLNDQLFSGYAVSFYGQDTLAERFGIFKGKKHGASIHYFSDGHTKRQSHYKNGKLDGEKKTWSSDPNHILLSHLNYTAGKAHGEQKKWYPTGELYMKLNLIMGKEEGLQQAYRKNGKLYANYEARNGRIFGLKKTNMCFGLEDEKIIYEK